MSHPSPRLLLIPFALAFVFLAAWRLWLSRDSQPASLLLSGNVEVTEIHLAFKIPGKIKLLRVAEGDLVRAGDLLAQLDDEELLHRRATAYAALQAASARLRQINETLLYQREVIAGNIQRATADLEQSRALLAQLLAGARPQEIHQAEARLAVAATELHRAAADWERAQRLHHSQDIPTAQFDLYRSRYETAAAQHQQALQALDLLREGARREDIDAARAAVARAQAALRLAEAGRLDLSRLDQERAARLAECDQARAQLALLDAQWRDSRLTAPTGGIVLLKAAEEGEIVAAGTTLLTLGDLQRPWIRAYLSEPHLGRVRLGDPVRVTTDSFPSKTYSGRLSFISSEAEFTPKQIQTHEERVKLVYRIKIDVSGAEGELKPNMPADALLTLRGP